ncbi:MAG: hypothetical protein AAFQ80_06925 [Cyanobacteria bacterium J06621_8]
MNAFEQIKSLEAIGKIEAVVHLFRVEFPECLADLKPWIQSEENIQQNDPNSIDIGFHFPDVNYACSCRSILMQVKVHRDSQYGERAIGICLAGYGAYQEQWQFSTVEYWEFSGMSKPKIKAQETLKKVCRRILELFNASEN